MFQLDKIDKVTRNRGGLQLLYLLFERDIINFPVANPVTGMADGVMQLVNDARAYPIYFTPKTASYTETTVINRNQPDSYTRRLVFQTPHDRPLTREFVAQIANQLICIVYRDWNGYWKIIRNLRGLGSIATNRKGGYNGTTFDFSGKDDRVTAFWEYLDNDVIEFESGIEIPVGTTDSKFSVSRQTFFNQSGATLTVADLPTDTDNIWVYRSTGKIPWGAGVTKVGDDLVFVPDLDGEAVEVVVFKPALLDADFLEPVREVYPNRTGATLDISGSDFVADTDLAYVFRGTRLIPWGAGVTRLSDDLQFIPALDAETIELLWFKSNPAFPYSTFAPYRLYLNNQTGAEITIPDQVPTNADYVMVFRGTTLVPWGAGVTRAINKLTFSPALQGENLEIVYFNFNTF